MKWMKLLTSTALGCAVMTGTAFSGSALAAKDYPASPIRIIVPFAPGDAIDNTARVMAERMRRVLGVPVIVQNIAGGGGSQGIAEAAQAAADGYTLVMASTGALTAGPLISDSGFVPEDFVPLAQLVENPLALAVSEASPYKDMQALVAGAKGKKLSYATPSPTTKQRISMTQFAQDHGFELTHVSGQGGTGAALKALSGEVDFVFTAAPVFVPMAKAGKLRVLAMGADERVPYLADVPTFKELGYATPDRLWFGLLVRRGTPEDVITRLEAAVKDAAAQPETKALYAKLNFTDAYLDGAAFQKVIDTNLANHKEVLNKLGLLKK